MTDNFSALIPEGLPPAYDKVVRDNSKLLGEIFHKDLLEKSPKLIQNLLHFLDVYIEVFNYAVKHTLPNETCAVFEGGSKVIRECVTKFRELFRKPFRGVQYLPPDLLKEISEKAMAETMHYFGTLTSPISRVSVENELRNILKVEQLWLEHINNHRRNQDLEIIKVETIENFKKKVTTTFSYLYNSDSDGMKYCDEIQLNRQLQELFDLAKQEYKEDIPFKDLESPFSISKLCSDFETCLNIFIQDVVQRNVNRKAIVEAYMDALVQNCVEKYSMSMENFLKGNCQTQLRLEEIFNHHKALVQEHVPKFTKNVNGVDTEIGTYEYRVQNWNKYGDKTHQIFQRLLQVKNEDTKTSLESCEREATEEVQICLEKVGKILAKYGLESFAGEFQSHVNSGLSSIIAHVNDSNNASGIALVESTKPIPIQVKNESNPSSILEECKLAYTEKLTELIRGSQTSGWGPINIPILDLCHNKAKQYIIQKVETERDKLKQVSEILFEFYQFSDYLISQAKTNLALFTDVVGQYEGTPVSFKATTGYDTKIKNGAAFQVSTRMQCLTCMKEYTNKSMEELQFEDRKKQRAVPLHIMVLSSSVPNLTTLFKKNLNFVGSPS